LDQLERRYCKDTPFFRPFYIGAPKGPFLPGLTINPPLFLILQEVIFDKRAKHT
jgi:hypothetical protein